MEDAWPLGPSVAEPRCLFDEDDDIGVDDLWNDPEPADRIVSPDPLDGEVRPLSQLLARELSLPW